MCVYSNILYGWAICQFQLCDEGGFDKFINLQDLLITPDDNVFGYFLEFCLSYPENIENQEKFHFVLKINFYLEMILMNLGKKLGHKLIYHIKINFWLDW